jgi:hypothetical protein
MQSIDNSFKQESSDPERDDVPDVGEEPGKAAQAAVNPLYQASLLDQLIWFLSGFFNIWLVI